MEKNNNYIYFDVRASVESGETRNGLKEVSLITSDEHFARFVATSCLNLGYTSVFLDKIETEEEMTL